MASDPVVVGGHGAGCGLGGGHGEVGGHGGGSKEGEALPPEMF